MSDYGISSNKPDIDFAAKELGYSALSGSRTIPNTSTWNSSGNGMTLTIPRDGKYRVVVEGVIYLQAAGGATSVRCNLRLVNNSVFLTDTARYFYDYDTINGAATSYVPFHIEYIGNFSAGDVVELEDWSDVTGATLQYSAGSNTGFMTYELLNAYVNTLPSITAWQSYVPAITGTTTDPTKGTVAVDVAWYREIDKELIINYQYRQTAAGAAGSGYYEWNLPGGYTVDNTKVNYGNHAYLGSCGHGIIWTTSSGEVHAHVTITDGTHWRLMRQIDQLGWVGNAVCPLSNTDVVYAVNIRVPIL
jgi:hypothetical protein